MLGGLKAWRLGGLELQEMGIGFGVSCLDFGVTGLDCWSGVINGGQMIFVSINITYRGRSA